MQKRFLQKTLGVTLAMTLATTTFFTGDIEVKADSLDFGTVEVVKGKTSTELLADTTITTFETEVPAEDSYVNTYTWKFTLEEDCVINYVVDPDVGDSHNADISRKFAIYKDAKMMNEVASTSKWYSSEPWILRAQFSKGTYYCKAQILYYDNRFSHPYIGDYLPLNISIQAVPLTDAIQLNYKVDKKNVILDVVNNVEDWMPATYAKYTDSFNTYVGADNRIYLEDAPCLSKNVVLAWSKYIEIAIAKPDSAGSTSSVMAGRLFKLDLTAPVIRVIKSGKKQTTIRATDSGTGVEKITLNGKKIISGTKIKKPGTYIVKATDKVGNTKTVRFTIGK